MKNLRLTFLLFFLWTCGGGGGGSSPTEPVEPTYIVNLVSLGGAAQKGPFNNGTIINIAELNNTLNPTGRNFTSQIVDNSGKFSVSNVQMDFPYAEIRASGFYFDEVGNSVSSAQLVLSGLSNLTGKTSMNVNVMSNLEMNRIKHLIANNSLTFAQAKIQAQEEVLAIFGYSRSGVAESELLDITQSGTGNAKLLAISAILQGDRTVGELSELLANISTDITTDGVINDSSINQLLLQSAYSLNLSEIRTNLEGRYTALGITVSIPDFESEVNNFYKPPVANDMSISTDEDTNINITLDASDPEGESLTFSTVEVNNATITISGNTATYEPDAQFNGTDTFTYLANDGSFNSNTATVTVTVGAIDDEPTTNDISTSTDEDVSVVMNLTADEYDGDSYSFSIISSPSNGTATLSGTQVTYTPNQDWNGTDTFTFEAADDRTARTNVATATIVVSAVNDAPIANDVNTSTDENLFNRDNIDINVTYDADNDILTGNTKGVVFNNTSSLDITLNATDVDGDNLTYSVVSTNNGTVTISGATATYEPNQDWNGTDTFTYLANDGALDSNTATVTITVGAVNDAPVTNDIPSSQDEDTSEVVDLSTQTSDIEGDALTYSIVSDVSNGTTSLSGSVVTYTPNQDWNGTDSYTYKANDGTDDSNVSTVNLTVNPVNDAPAVPEINNSTNEDIATTFDLNGTDVEDVNGSTQFTYNIVTQPSNGTATIGGVPNNQFNMTYTPNANWNGTETITYKANDGSLDSNTGTITITVTAVNDAPTTNDLSVTIDENRTARIIGINLDGADVDGDDLTYSVVSDASNNTANQDWNGTETITYKANDGTLDSNTSTITITVTSINDVPVASAISASTNEDTAKAITLSATDVEGDNLTYSIVSSPSNGSLGSVSGTSVTYTPNADWNGTDTFTYKANDGTADSNTATVTVTVAAVNDAPIAYGFNQTTEEDNAKTITLRQTSPGSNTGTNNEGGVYDPDIETDQDTPITFSLVSQPSNGTATLANGDNDVTYTPNANWNGTDTFTYKGNDGTADSNTATVTVTVTAVNDAPTVNDISTTIDENLTARLVGITLDGADVDGDDLTYSIVSNASNGTTSISGATLTYTANQDWNGTETITYKANDGTLDSNTGTITITVNAVNDAPVVTGSGDSSNGGSLQFDGSSNDKVEFDVDWTSFSGYTTNTASEGDGIEDFTISMWVKLDEVNTPYYFIDNQSGNTDLLAFNINGSNQLQLYYQGNGGYRTLFTGSNPLTSANEWYHLVITRNYHPEEDGLTQGGPSGPSGNVACGSDTGNGVRLYINGQFYCSRYDGGTRYNWDQGLQLGLGNANDQDFDGNMDGFAIWDDDLTANEVSRIYDLGRGSDLTSNSGNYTSSSDLEIFYNFNDGSSTTLDDITGNSSQDGTVSGASFISLNATINATTNEDTAKAITLSATDVDGDNLTYSVVAAPDSGSVSLSGSTATYTPNTNFNGTDTFTYKANDGTVDSETGTVNITIAAVNDAPVSSAVSASTNEDTAKAITLSATDVEGSSLTYSIVSNPSNGSLSSVSGTGVTYTPSANWNGTDTFTYKANDGTVDSNTATVTITVVAVDDIPVVDAQTLSTNEDTAVSVTLTATDVDGDTIEFAIDTAPSNGTLNPNTASWFDGQFDYTPNLNYNGTDTILVKAKANGQQSVSVNITINIAAVNDIPTAADVTLNLPYESDHSYSVDMTTGASDVEGSNLTYQMLSTDNLTGSYSHDGSSGTGTFTSSTNFTGSAGYITYRASDGTAWSHSNTSGGKININITNDAPVASAVSASTNEDTAKAITLSATDAQSNSLTYSIVSNPSNGSLGNVSGTSVTYTPNANWNGTDTFTYKANDGPADSNTATVTVTVAAVNDLPTTTNYSVGDGTEDTNYLIDVFDTDNSATGTKIVPADIDGDTLTISIVSQGSNGTASVSGQRITYAPNANWNGTDTFTFKANDGIGDSNTSTVTVTVNAVNDIPTAADVTLNLPYESDRSYSIDMTTGASDVEGSNLTYQMLSTDNLTGSYSHNGSSGTGTFTANANFTGSAGYITYRASDGTDWSHSNTSGGKIYINITDTPGTKSLSFDGSNDEVTVSEDASLVATHFTYQFWIKPAQANPGGAHLRVLSRGNDGGSQNRLIVSHDPNETLQFGLFSDVSNGGRSETVNTNATLTTAWTHVVITFGTNGAGKIYLNGSADVTFDISEDDASHVDSGGLRIGSDGGSSDFNGKIDEVAFWDSVLTDAEVTALYNSGNGLDAASNSGNYTSSSDLQAYWKMSEQTGGSVADSSTNNNAGSVSGASWSHE